MSNVCADLKVMVNHAPLTKSLNEIFTLVLSKKIYIDLKKKKRKRSSSPPTWLRYFVTCLQTRNPIQAVYM